MISPQKHASFFVALSISTLCILCLLATLVSAVEYDNRQRAAESSLRGQKLPRAVQHQKLFRGVRRRKLGIRKRKQMAAAPLTNPNPYSLPEYILGSSDKIDNTREEKKIEQSNGKLLRRKVMRRKRPFPTIASPLPYQDNRKSSRPYQFSPTYNLTVKSPIYVPDEQIAQQGIKSSNEIALKKIRRKKIPVSDHEHLSSSKVVTYKPKTTPMLPLGNLTMEQREGALNRTVDEKRFLSLFTIVTFKNDACASTAGSNGTCYSSSDCSKLGGTASGTCASGFGVCCLFTKTCGQSTSQNCTYFQNEGYPSTFDAVGSCQLTVNKCATNVCQLRLDFDNFVVAQPEGTDHVCQNDQFVVSGGPPIPAICGVNTGLHMYVDMGLASNAPITLTVVTSGSAFSRSFSIKVTQIDCFSLSKANDGCLQYFTGVSGQMKSFNYNDASGLQLSNTDYTMCVRTERNFCGIQYTACPDTVNMPEPMSFSIAGSDGSIGSANTACTTDWITIPCATNTLRPDNQGGGSPSVCVDRICGMVFNSVDSDFPSPSSPVNSFRTPFNIFVHTDSEEGSSSPTETLNRGFCLDYIQQPCSTNSG